MMWKYEHPDTRGTSHCIKSSSPPCNSYLLLKIQPHQLCMHPRYIRECWRAACKLFRRTQILHRPERVLLPIWLQMKSEAHEVRVHPPSRASSEMETSRLDGLTSQIYGQSGPIGLPTLPPTRPECLRATAGPPPPRPTTPVETTTPHPLPLTPNCRASPPGGAR